MSGREIKFRAYTEGKFYYFTLQEILERRMSYRGDWDERVMRAPKEQYTGLKDKNGKEVYDGDILQRYKRSGEKYASTKTVSWGYTGFIKLDYVHECEIIGNIHEK